MYHYSYRVDPCCGTELFIGTPKLLQVVGDKPYDPLDLDEKEFLEDYDQFTDQIHDLDKRLGSILCQGFDDCSGLESAFRVCIYTSS